MDRRALPALIAGLAGAALGLSSAAFGDPWLAGLSAISSLFAAICGLVTLGHLRDAEARERRPGRAGPVADGAGWVGTDPETGLPDARFFELALDNRVSVARRRLWPVSVLLLEVGAGTRAPLAPGEAVAFVLVLRRTLRDADTICRIGPRTFAVILEDSSDGGGVWTAERVLSMIERNEASLPPVTAAIASYPAHGLRSAELLSRARHALEQACAPGGTGAGPGAVQVARIDATP